MTERLRLSSSERKQLVQRAGACCEYCLCQEQFSPDPFSIEHIIPRVKGGTHEIDNLAFACQGCNNRKYVSTTAIDPVTGNIVELYHPRRNLWAEHFAWNEDFTFIIGLTPQGRSTVEKLQLNRSGVVNLRRVLASVGKHPPG